jgi:hypothetical protein
MQAVQLGYAPRVGIAHTWSLDILKTGFGGRQREAARRESQAAALPTIIG